MAWIDKNRKNGGPKKTKKNKHNSPSQSISPRIDGKFIESSAHVIEIRGDAFLLVANKISDTC